MVRNVPVFCQRIRDPAVEFDNIYTIWKFHMYICEVHGADDLAQTPIYIYIYKLDFIIPQTANIYFYSDC